VKIACTDCHPRGFYIAPLEQLLSARKGTHPNLASANQRLNIVGTDRVMAVFADDRYRFCVCNPGVTHMRDILSLLERTYKFGVAVTKESLTYFSYTTFKRPLCA
jgi:hypothetical protein